MNLSPQPSPAVNGPLRLLRRLSARWKTEKGRNVNRSSSSVESRGAAVPYHDPDVADVADDGELDDYVLRKESTNVGDGDKENIVDSENNEVFASSSSDVIDTSSSLSCALPIVSNSQSTTMELLSATALLRRAHSVGQRASDVNGSHVIGGDHVVANGSHHVGNGVNMYVRSKSSSQVQNGQGILGKLIMFDVRRDLLASLAESGDTERLRAVLKTDNEAVNGTDENGNTALHKAAMKGHSHAVRMLLLYGADVELKNKSGDSALSLAVTCGHSGVAAVLTDYIQSFNKRPQESFVVLRARLSRHVISPDCYVIERVRSCAELKSFRRRGIDFVHLLVAQGQKVNDLAVFMHSVLDVPVGHAFFIHGLGSDLNMNNFQRFDDDLHLLNESITVINTRLNSMQAVKFRCLRRLVLVDCNLSELVLDTLECLEILDIRRNKLTSLPPSVGHCRRLRTLRVASNELRQLPDRELGCLRRLVAFDCSFNRLKRLPTHIVQCGELTILECNDNGLVELPVDIGLLICLEELRAHNNRLSQLPVSISALSRLRRVSFSGNPLTNIPVDFPERASDVRQYLESLQEDPVANKTVKLVVVGQEGVGKTCLLKALRRTSWRLPASATDIPATEGIEVREMKLNDVTLRCFDCCGDVDFSETHNFFITRGAIYLVCFNLAEYCMASVERDSFLLGRLQLWLQYIFTKVPDARVLLVGTHADHPGLNRTMLEEIWDLLRRLMVDARDHHCQYFSPCTTPVMDSPADFILSTLHKNFTSGDVDVNSASTTRCATRLADCLLCQQDSRCYRRSVSATGTSGGFVNLGFTRSTSLTARPPHLTDRSMSGVEEETSFCSGDARAVAFPHVVGYYEVSCIRNVGTTAAASTGPDNVNGVGVGGGSGQNRGIEHLKTAIYELATKLIEENPEVPRSWSRVAESLWARRQRDCVMGGDVDGRWGVVGGPMATVDEVAEIAAVQGVKDRREIARMLQFLKAQGVLLYFPQLADLDELVILDPVWLARIFCAVQSSRDSTSGDDRGFVDRDRLRAIWRSAADTEDPDSESRDRRILTLLRHFGLCVPVEGTKFELFPSRLPLCDRELDPNVWRPLPDPRRERQVTYSATFPSIIPPPFFNRLIAAFYSYRSESPPTSPRSSSPVVLLCSSGKSSSSPLLDRCPQYAHYFADRLVDWLRIDRPGCRDCRSASSSGSDADDGNGESSSRGDGQSLYHRVLIELIAHRRTIQVTARGKMPCCAIKKVSRIFDRVVRQFEGLGNIQINSVVCPGCVVASHATYSGLDPVIGSRLQKHKYSEMQLVTSLERTASMSEESGDSRLCCSNGHVTPSTRDLLRGVIGDWFEQYSVGGGVTSSRTRDGVTSQVAVQSTQDCPRLFILLPVNRDGLSFDAQLHLYASTLVPDGYAVHLLCEFPDGYHVTCEPGYRLRNPREFIRRYGSHVVSTLRLLIRLGSSSVVTAQYAMRTRAVARTADSLIRDLLTRFPALKTVIARENVRDRSSREQVSTNQRSLRRDEFRRHLHLADHRPDVFGPLRRIRCRIAGNIEEFDECGGTVGSFVERTLWLCDDHFKQMKDAAAAMPIVTSFSIAHNLSRPNVQR